MILCSLFLKFSWQSIFLHLEFHTHLPKQTSWCYFWLTILWASVSYHSSYFPHSASCYSLSMSSNYTFSQPQAFADTFCFPLNCFLLPRLPPLSALPLNVPGPSTDATQDRIQHILASLLQQSVHDHFHCFKFIYRSISPPWPQMLKGRNYNFLIGYHQPQQPCFAPVIQFIFIKHL